MALLSGLALVFVFLVLPPLANSSPTASATKITIKLADTADTDDALEFANSRVELDPQVFPVRLDSGVFRFLIAPEMNYDSALSGLRTDSFLVNPVMELGGDRFIYYGSRVVVTYSAETQDSIRDSLDLALGCSRAPEDEAAPDIYYVNILDPRGRSGVDVAADYVSSGLCEDAWAEEYITPLLRETTGPRDYRFRQWPLENSGDGGVADADIDAAHAWQVTAGTRAVKVAVLDGNFGSGWDAPQDSAGYFIYYPADPWLSSHGYWTWPPACDYEDESFEPAFGVRVSCAHGTGVVGILAAQHNEFGIDGIAPDCSYTGIRLFDDMLAISDVDAHRALMWAGFDLGAKIIVNSWDFRPLDARKYFMTRRALDSLRNVAHAAVFFAAGNDGAAIADSSAFASDSNVFAVGATNRSDSRWYYSNTGPELDFMAPAGDRTTAAPLGGDEATWDLGDPSGIAPPYDRPLTPCTNNHDSAFICGAGGTSMACPKAAGVAALSLSMHPEFFDSADVGMVLYNVLKNSAEDKGAMGYDESYGWGRVNARRALALTAKHGDPNLDGKYDVLDMSLVVSGAFRNGNLPVYFAGGDINCDGVYTVLDVVLMAQVAFMNADPGVKITPCKSDLDGAIACPPPHLISRADRATNVLPDSVNRYFFDWETLYWSGGLYRIQIDTSKDFSYPILDVGNLTSTEFSTQTLAQNTRYYWRVFVSGVDCEAKPTVIWSFVTGPSSPMYEVTPDEVIVESLELPCGTDSATVGVYISNSVPLSALVLPLETREVSGNGAFHSPAEFRIKNRLVDKLDAYSPLVQYLPERDASGSACDGAGFSTRGDFEEVDNESPDAVAFLGIATEDSLMLPEGTDDVEEPSLELVFDVSGFQGVFEIDTTCIAPANHLLFIDGSQIDNTVPIVPSFTKATVTVGGIGELSGHVVGCDTLGCEVNFTADVTVDSGATLTILPSARITVSDSASLKVFGELIFDTSAAGRPEFFCEGDSWRGIWILQGGTADWGRGCVINDANTAVRIDPGATSSEIRNVAVIDPITAGFEISQAVDLTNDTINASGAEYGLIVNGCDPTVDSASISGCATSIYAVGSSGHFSAISIKGPGAYGIYAVTDAENSGEDTLTLDQVAITGRFTGAHLLAEAQAHCQLDSCSFLTETVDGLQSHFGIKAYDDAFVRVRNSLILNCDTAFYSYNSKADLGTSASAGNNSIYKDSCAGSCPGSKVIAECELDFLGGEGEGSEKDGPGGPPPPEPICLIKAEGNWWGSSTPSASWLTNVDYTPWLTEDPLGKVSAWSGHREVMPRSLEVSASNYPNPFNPATTIEFNLTVSGYARIVVYNVLGQEVREVANAQFSAGKNRIVWDGRDTNRRNVASGIYLYRITTSSGALTRKMALLR